MSAGINESTSRALLQQMRPHRAADLEVVGPRNLSLMASVIPLVRLALLELETRENNNKDNKNPASARAGPFAPTWLGRVESRERLSRYVEASFKFSCDRVGATEHAPRNPFRILERRHGLAEIVERGAGVSV